jgi:hypothetical protein
MGVEAHAWIWDITGPLTIPMLVQYNHLRHRLDDFDLVPKSKDRLIWRWCASGQYSTNSTYQAMFLGQSAMLGAKELPK